MPRPRPTPTSISRAARQYVEPMPIITVDMWAGRTVEQKRILVKELTEAFVRASGGSPGGVQIVLRDVPKENWAVGGQLYSDRDGG